MGLFLLRFAASPTPGCPARGNALVVRTADHRLVLGQGGAEVGRCEVALGSGGVAAGRVGWAQTPLGAFVLASPRPSSQFHTFIPLVNPDPTRFSAWASG